jgi:hypothetical protein
MFFQILTAEIIGTIVGLIIGVLGLLIGGRQFFHSYWFIALLITVSLTVGLFYFKMMIT